VFFHPFTTIPAFLFALMGIILSLMLVSRKTRQSKAARWVERFAAILTPLSFVGPLILFREAIESLMWGFYVSMSGIVLASANSISVWMGERRKAKAKSSLNR
jgi:hypothetical protein